MIYNYGTIWFYETKANRQYDSAGNENILHHFITDSIPDFQFVVTGTVVSATYQLYDKDDTLIDNGSCTITTATNGQSTAYSIVSLTSATTSGEDDGKYYLKITYNDGVEKYAYSDIFCWQTDVSNYLKISATTTAMKIGAFPMNDFTYEVYLESGKFKRTIEVQEDGDEKTYGVVPSFVSTNKIFEHEIAGYNKTLDFLAGLRVASVNGTVNITWAGDSYDVYDILAEDANVFANKQNVILLKYKTKDYLQTYNEV